MNVTCVIDFKRFLPQKKSPVKVRVHDLLVSEAPERRFPPPFAVAQREGGELERGGGREEGPCPPSLSSSSLSLFLRCEKILRARKRGKKRRGGEDKKYLDRRSSPSSLCVLASATQFYRGRGRRRRRRRLLKHLSLPSAVVFYVRLPSRRNEEVEKKEYLF